MGKDDKYSSKFLVKTKKNMIKLQTKVKKLKKSWFDSLEMKHFVIIIMLLLGTGYGVYWYIVNFNSSEDLDYEQLKVEIEENLRRDLAKDQSEESPAEIKETSSESADIVEERTIDRATGEISEAKESRPDYSFKQEIPSKEQGEIDFETEVNEEDVIETGGKSEEFLLPVDGEKTNAKQWYKDEVLKVWRFNPGVDIKAAAGSEVKAAAAGEIEEIKEDDYLGTEVIIKHHSGLKTIYFNLTDVNLKQGDQVARGEKIGLIKDNIYYEEDMIRFKIKQDSNYLEIEDYFQL